MKRSGNMQNEISWSENALVNGVAAKKVVVLDEVGNQAVPGHLYGYDAATATWRPIQVVESTVSPGEYVLAVGNIDGSAITGGGGTGTGTGYGYAIYETDVYS